MRQPTIYLFIVLFHLGYHTSVGQLHISPGKHYIEEAGRPFLWIGDTAWELFHKLSREDAKYYLQTRAKQGFTVIQAVLLAEQDGLRTPNYYGDLPLYDFDPKKPNEAYFEHVDTIINMARELGLYLAILPTWADKVKSDRPGKGPVVFNTDNAYVYGRFLGTRYANSPVVWMLGGDRNVLNDSVKAIWAQMAKGLQAEGKHAKLITYHPAGESSSSQWFHQASWLGFNSYQTGHAYPYFPVYKFAARDYALQPIKPVIDAEPAYEDIPIRFWEFIDWTGKERVPPHILDDKKLIKDKNFFKYGYFSDYDVRVHAYWNFLSGACGYTYGHHAIWQFFSANDTFDIPCLQEWKASLKRPGAASMLPLKKILTARNFAQLIPDNSLILGKNNNDSTYLCAARAEGNSFALVYAARGQQFTINSTIFSGKLVAHWYRPKDGYIIPIPLSKGSQLLTFVPPTSGKNHDWLLVLDVEEANLPSLSSSFP